MLPPQARRRGSIRRVRRRTTRRRDGEDLDSDEESADGGNLVDDSDELSDSHYANAAELEGTFIVEDADSDEGQSDSGSVRYSSIRDGDSDERRMGNYAAERPSDSHSVSMGSSLRRNGTSDRRDRQVEIGQRVARRNVHERLYAENQRTARLNRFADDQLENVLNESRRQRDNGEFAEGGVAANIRPMDRESEMFAEEISSSIHLSKGVTGSFKGKVMLRVATPYSNTFDALCDEVSDCCRAIRRHRFFLMDGGFTGCDTFLCRFLWFSKILHGIMFHVATEDKERMINRLFVGGRDDNGDMQPPILAAAFLENRTAGNWMYVEAQRTGRDTFGRPVAAVSLEYVATEDEARVQFEAAHYFARVYMDNMDEVFYTMRTVHNIMLSDVGIANYNMMWRKERMNMFISLIQGQDRPTDSTVANFLSLFSYGKMAFLEINGGKPVCVMMDKNSINCEMRGVIDMPLMALIKEQVDPIFDDMVKEHACEMYKVASSYADQGARADQAMANEGGMRNPLDALVSRAVNSREGRSQHLPVDACRSFIISRVNRYYQIIGNDRSCSSVKRRLSEVPALRIAGGVDKIINSNPRVTYHENVVQEVVLRQLDRDEESLHLCNLDIGSNIPDETRDCLKACMENMKHAREKLRECPSELSADLFRQRQQHFVEGVQSSGQRHARKLPARERDSLPSLIKLAMRAQGIDERTGKKDPAIPLKDADVIFREPLFEDFVTRNTHVNFTDIMKGCSSLRDFTTKPEAEWTESMNLLAARYLAMHTWLLVMTGDIDMHAFLFLFLCSTIYGVLVERQMLNIVGPDGSEGKTVFGNFLVDAFGGILQSTYAHVLAPSFWSGSNDGKTTEVHNASGTHIMITPEQEPHKLDSSRVIRTITSSDYDSQRTLFVNNTPWQNSARVIRFMNSLPPIDSHLASVVNRIFIIPVCSHFQTVNTRALSSQRSMKDKIKIEGNDHFTQMTRRLAPVFHLMLILYFRLKQEYGMYSDAAPMRAAHAAYFSDPIAEFLKGVCPNFDDRDQWGTITQNEITPKAGRTTDLKTAFLSFRSWARENGRPLVPPAWTSDKQSQGSSGNNNKNKLTIDQFITRLVSVFKVLNLPCRVDTMYADEQMGVGDAAEPRYQHNDISGIIIGGTIHGVTMNFTRIAGRSVAQALMDQNGNARRATTAAAVSQSTDAAAAAAVVDSAAGVGSIDAFGSQRVVVAAAETEAAVVARLADMHLREVAGSGYQDVINRAAALPDNMPSPQPNVPTTSSQMFY